MCYHYHFYFLMDIIQNFLKKHNLRDKLLDSYTLTDIEKIVRVINGDFTDCENNANSAEYAGCCLDFSIHRQPEPNKNAEYYYLIAMESDHYYAPINLARLYEKQNKLNLVEKYYLLAVHKGNTDAMCRLGIFYYNNRKFELAKKYYLLMLENNQYYPMLDEIFTNKIEFYLALSKIENKCNAVREKIISLISDKQVKCYVNRKNLWSKTDTCLTCSNKTFLVPMECTHFYCEECYVKVGDCPVCNLGV